ncbi:hypothetical protein ACFL0D_04165 [Thermoproteota archaeon]
MPRKRRAIGEIIAALILILIASLAGVLLFTTSVRTSNVQGKILRTQIQTESESAQERFQVLNAVNEGNTFKIWVYNYGKVDVEIVDVYINGVRTDLSNKTPISSETPPLKITVTVSGVSGPNYKITVVSERGVKNVSDWSL